MNAHILHRDVKGTGILETITPVCSCGWIGIGYAAHNDYQISNVRDQEKKHLHTVSLDVIVRGKK